MVVVSKCKEITKLVNQLLATGGWSLKRGTRHPYHLVHISGWKYAIPWSPSDHRSYQNLKSDTRKAIAFGGWASAVPCRID